LRCRPPATRPRTRFGRPCQRPRHDEGEPVALSKPAAIPLAAGRVTLQAPCRRTPVPHSRHGY
jgi:hypothetical protein